MTMIAPSETPTLIPTWTAKPKVGVGRFRDSVILVEVGGKFVVVLVAAEVVDSCVPGSVIVLVFAEVPSGQKAPSWSTKLC